MSERLTAEEIERLREELPEWHHAMPLHVIRIAEHMLRLHDERKALQQKLLTPLAVILCQESHSGWKAHAWVQVVTAFGITLKDVIEAIPPEMVRE